MRHVLCRYSTLVCCAGVRRLFNPQSAPIKRSQCFISDIPLSPVLIRPAAFQSSFDDFAQRFVTWLCRIPSWHVLRRHHAAKLRVFLFLLRRGCSGICPPLLGRGGCHVRARMKKGQRFVATRSLVSDFFACAHFSRASSCANFMSDLAALRPPSPPCLPRGTTSRMRTTTTRTTDTSRWVSRTSRVCGTRFLTTIRREHVFRPCIHRSRVPRLRMQRVRPLPSVPDPATL